MFKSFGWVFEFFNNLMFQFLKYFRVRECPSSDFFLIKEGYFKNFKEPTVFMNEIGFI